MRLKTFTAKSMASAMAEIRATLGPDAIIVNSRSGGKNGGVRVTAALEGNVPGPAREPGPVRPRSAAGARLADLVAEAEAEGPACTNGLDQIDAILDHHGLPEALKASLKHVAHSVNAENADMALAAALDAEFTFRPLTGNADAPLVFVGPPGAGKTLAIAKIAAAAVLAGRPVGLITADTVRTGGVDQLKGFAKLLKLDVLTAHSLTELSDMASSATQDYDLTLVDTAGCNPFDDEDLGRTHEAIEAAGGEPLLVAPAGGDYAEAQETAEVFAGLGCRRVIATRFDAVRRYASVLALAQGGPLAFAGASATPYVGEAVQPLNPLFLARLLSARPIPAPSETNRLARNQRKFATS